MIQARFMTAPMWAPTYFDVKRRQNEVPEGLIIHGTSLDVFGHLAVVGIVTDDPELAGAKFSRRVPSSDHRCIRLHIQERLELGGFETPYIPIVKYDGFLWKSCFGLEEVEILGDPDGRKNVGVS